MSYSNEETLKALTIIKNICEEKGCRACPFSCQTTCLVNADYPCEWRIAQLTDVWKALF